MAVRVPQDSCYRRPQKVLSRGGIRPRARWRSRCTDEECDDGNDDELDMCTFDCVATSGVRQLARGSASRFACVTFEDRSAKCWGSNLNGELGYGHTNPIGDDELPALLQNGDMKCWGQNAFGELGYGHIDNVGDDETPATVGTVALGADALQINASRYATCAMLEDRSVKCFGDGSTGLMGNASADNLGDDELPSDYASIALR